MSLLKTIDNNPTFEPKKTKTMPERLVEGDPSYKTWALDEARDGTVKTGILKQRPVQTALSKVRPSSFATSFQA